MGPSEAAEGNRNRDWQRSRCSCRRRGQHGLGWWWRLLRRRRQQQQQRLLTQALYAPVTEDDQPPARVDARDRRGQAPGKGRGKTPSTPHLLRGSLPLHCSCAAVMHPRPTSAATAPTARPTAARPVRTPTGWHATCRRSREGTDGALKHWSTDRATPSLRLHEDAVQPAAVGIDYAVEAAVARVVAGVRAAELVEARQYGVVDPSGCSLSATSPRSVMR